MATGLAYVRRGGGYQYGDRKVVTGEVVDLLGLPNDEKLLRLGYLALMKSKTRTFECGRCGRKFIEEGLLNMHGRNDHDRKRSDNPEDEDARHDNDMAKLDAIAPLYLDKTSASQRA